MSNLELARKIEESLAAGTQEQRNLIAELVNRLLDESVEAA